MGDVLTQFHFGSRKYLHTHICDRCDKLYKSPSKYSIYCPKCRKKVGRKRH